jgi:hypothetical protein
MIETLRPLIAERRACEGRLSQLLRRPAGREALNHAVGQPAEATMEVWPAEARRALLLALAEDRAAVLRRGAALVAEGKSEAEALAILQREQCHRAERFLRRLRELAG